MKLIGQYDSPFVRRVGIALLWYQLPFEHLPLSVFGDAEELAHYNPLRRVPTLVQDDGTPIIDSFACLEVLDMAMAATHGPTWSRLLMPRSGHERVKQLRLCALAAGTGDKVVSLVYEERIRESRSTIWTRRCTAQVTDGLLWLEQECEPDAPQATSVSALTHADIACSCVLTFISQAQPQLLNNVAVPRLHALQQRCEARPEFRAISAPFTVKPVEQVRS